MWQVYFQITSPSIPITSYYTLAFISFLNLSKRMWVVAHCCFECVTYTCTTTFGILHFVSLLTTSLLAKLMDTTHFSTISSLRYAAINPPPPPPQFLPNATFPSQSSYTPQFGLPPCLPTLGHPKYV
jgi:hypothetical protein